MPLLFSEVMNLHPLAIILSVLFFGNIFGFWGVFFAIPLMTLVSVVVKSWPKENKEYVSLNPNITLEFIDTYVNIPTGLLQADIIDFICLSHNECTSIKKEIIEIKRILLQKICYDIYTIINDFLAF